MASETATTADAQTRTSFEPWQAGVIGGVVGSIAFGAMMAMMAPAMLVEMIPMMYGLEGGLAGWFVHISHGAVLGVVFATILVAVGKSNLGPAASAGAGIGYGIVVWVALAVVVMPVWLGMPEMVPNVDVGSLAGHAIYGVLLGVVYSILQ